MVCYEIGANITYDLAKMLNAELNNAEVKTLINGNEVRFNVFSGSLAVEVNGEAYNVNELGSVDYLDIESDIIGKDELNIIKENASEVCLATLVNVFELNGLIYYAYSYSKLDADNICIKHDDCGIVDIQTSRFGYVNSTRDAIGFFIIGGEAKTKIYDFDFVLENVDFDFVLENAWANRITSYNFSEYAKGNALLSGYDLGSYKGKTYSLVSKLLNFGYGDDYFTPLTTERNLVAIEKALEYVNEYAKDLYKSLINSAKIA